MSSQIQSKAIASNAITTAKLSVIIQNQLASITNPTNYFANYNFAIDPTSGMVTNLTTTGNRTSNTTVWGSNTTSLLSYVTSNPLRPPGMAQIAVTGANGAQFVETPMFTLQLADVSLSTSFYFESQTTGTFATGNIDLVIIRYDASGNYIGIITPTSSTLMPSTLSRVAGAFTGSATSTDQYAFRWRSQNASLRTIQLTSLSIGPIITGHLA